MYFTGFEERLFGSRAKVKVLRYLVRNADHGQVGYDMAKLLGLSPTQVMSILKEFEDVNLVYHNLVGRAKTWEVNKSSFAYEQAAKVFAYENEARNKVWAVLEECGVKVGRDGIVEMQLFGSIPNKTEGPDSDIDLLVIVKEKKDIERVAELLDKAGSCKIRSTFGNQLSPLVFTKKEYEQGMRKGKPPFGSIKEYLVYRYKSVAERKEVDRIVKESRKEAIRKVRRWN